MPRARGQGRGGGRVRPHQRGDVSAASAFYELALQCCSSKVEIGKTILIKVEGYAKVAEVECVEENLSMDVTSVETGEERTVQEKDVLLWVQEPDPNHLQERILLNLTRCLLQLAEVTSLPQQHRPLYLRSAVLGCTLVLALAEFYKTKESDEKEATLTEKTSLLLRSQAYSSMNKFPHAMADAKRLMTLDPQHNEGRKWLQSLEHQKIQNKKTDKRLSKEVSRWVQTSMKETVISEGNHQQLQQDTSPSSSHVSPTTKSFNSTPWLALALVLILAWTIQKHL
jgi:hypothetical protein